MGQALSYALRLLKRRPYSVWEIKQALSKRSLEPAEIEPIIQELVEHKLLDDRQYALSFVHTKDRLHPEGEFKLRQDLARKGVDEETVVWALKEAHLTEEEAESEDERALKLLNQYWRRWERELSLIHI